MNTRIIISTTAQQHGYGRDPWKWVSHMTKDEREFVKSGGIVAFRSEAMSGGTYGTYWRVVKYQGGRYLPRVPSNVILAALGE